ncbi:MAG: ATP-grasp domain-containing protein [Acidobacteria bacterium]|nr:MAG: ATP-grasp domain-containing protein [Acidobacteriota bacterium]
MSSTFQRVLIVNRGEPAMRLIHAVREFNQEHQADLRTIALYTDAERRAMFVREADEAVYLGAATFVDERDGGRKVGYLDYGRLESALRESGAEAAWVGWGFVAEHAGFADLCRDLGVVFIGPRPEVMRRLGDKITSKRLAERAGVPVAAWSGGPVETLDEARDHAASLGCPLMIKATAGGGGRGIRKVHAPEELAEAFETARSEARKSFGEPAVFLETMIVGARHVEVQIVGDSHGTVWPLGVRDCTIQRRNQKILEEAPSPALTAEEDRELREAAARLAREVGYENAGTVEFLFDPRDRSFHFMEVNARLQVEHPVTEMTTGLDLVKLQIDIARGGRLEGSPPTGRGHAVEVRLNAEDAESGFAPAPGTVELFRLPSGPGVRVDTGVQEGDAVPHEFDSMIAKIIAHGRDRDEALARLHRALLESAVVIRGGTSNKGFLLGLLDRPEVRSGEVDIGWLDGLVRQAEHLSARHADVALLQAAIEAYQMEIEVEKTRFLVSAGKGRPEVSDKVGRAVELRYRGNTYELVVNRLGVRRFRVTVDDQRIDITIEPLGRSQSRLSVGEKTYAILSVIEGLTHLVEVDGVPHRISRDHGGIIRSPAPAVVVSLAVESGQEVEPGDRLATIEAMKMEMPVVAEFAGSVRKLMVMENVQVGTGDPLIVIEPSTESATGVAGDRVQFTGPGAPPADDEPMRARCRANLEELRCVIRGFDVDSAELGRLVADREELCRGMPPADPEMREREEEILAIFVDICSLFRRHPAGDELDDGGRLSAAEYFQTYLREIDALAENLPQGFVAKLRRALAHYGVEDLERTPELESSLFRLWRSNRRMAEQTVLVLTVLGRWLESYEDLSPVVGDTFRLLLDRMILETRDRFPAVHDSAREVRYRYFGKGMLEEARWQIYAQAEAHLAYLDSRPDAVERDERIAALVDCPQPLKSLISSQFGNASPALREAMLEVITRRYYRVRTLGSCRIREVDGQPFACFEYDRRGKQIYLVTTHSSFDELATSIGRVSRALDSAPAESDIAIDFYIWRQNRHEETESTLEHILSLLKAAKLSQPIRRLVIAISSPERGLGLGDVEHFTFRQTATGFAEERLYRGLHPMLGKRLQLWRLSNFEIERLSSREDLYLFRGVARENPKDERLFALAEIRDLTPVRDEAGRITELPLLEHMFMEALAGIRRFQSERSPRERLHWNRVLLYVWPPFDLTAEELNALINRLMPETEGLGLDKVLVRARIRDPKSGKIRVSLLDISLPVQGPYCVSADRR